MADPCLNQGVIAGLQSDIKTIFKRIDEQLQITKAVYDMTAEMRVMNHRIQVMQKDVEELKNTPKKRMDAIVGAAIGAVVTGLVAFLLFKLGLS